MKFWTLFIGFSKLGLMVFVWLCRTLLDLSLINTIINFSRAKRSTMRIVQSKIVK